MEKPNQQPSEVQKAELSENESEQSEKLEQGLNEEPESRKEPEQAVNESSDEGLEQEQEEAVAQGTDEEGGQEQEAAVVQGMDDELAEEAQSEQEHEASQGADDAQGQEQDEVISQSTDGEQELEQDETDADSQDTDDESSHSTHQDQEQAPTLEAEEASALEVKQEQASGAFQEEGHSAEQQPGQSAASSEKVWLRHYPQQIRHTLDYPQINIAQFLIDAATNYPQKPALTFMGKTLTYERLYTEADVLARGLGRLGVKKGDRVAIMLPNCPQAVISYYGVLLAGAIVVQTNPLYVERELKHQLKDSGAVALIALDLLYPRISRVRGKNPEEGEVPKLKTVVITSIKDGLPFPKSWLYPIKQRREGFKANIPYGIDGYVSWKMLFSRAALSFERPTLPLHDEVAALQYTGGTTGTPKGVMLTHRNLVSNTLQSLEWCERIRLGEEKYLAALPLFHVFGLTVLMNMSVCSGGCLVLLPKFEVQEVLRTIDRQKPSIFPGAPTMYIAIINAAGKLEKPIDLSSIEICISGSAALPLEVQETFEKLTGGRLIEGYGLSEASPVTHANPIWGRRKIGTIGVPFPDTDAAIISLETGEFLPPGEVGELVVKGPQVMKGYWNNESATEAVFHQGWLRTGDLALMDEDGYFMIKDRIKDIIIAGGFNIYPREIEEVLYEHPAIVEAAVIGVKDSYRGETVKAYIVLKDKVAVSEEHLNLWCRERLAAYKVPHIYVFREFLPKTMVGKVLKRQLLAEEEQQHE